MASLPIDLSAMGTNEELIHPIDDSDVEALKLHLSSGFGLRALVFEQFTEPDVVVDLEIITIAFRASGEEVFFSDFNVESVQNHFHLFISGHIIVNSITHSFR